MGKEQRRRYGSIHEENERERASREYGRGKRSRSSWLRVLLFPLRMIWIVVRAFFRAFSGRPRLSARAKKQMIRRMLWLGFTGFVVLFVGGTVMALWVGRDLPDPDRLTDREIAQSTKIYDRTGEHLLYEIFAEEKRTLVKLEQIPQHVINGVIATEDKTFYEHKGIRPKSILRAAVVGLIPGRRLTGASTLTQQLVKNAILTNERRLTRKIKEAILSVRLEQEYSKDQILQIYFNEIPYGSTNYGVEAAAQSYFGKTVSDVTLGEAAVLAGLPKAPSRYLNDMDALKERRDFVLRHMYQEGYISQEEKEQAQNEPLALKQTFSGEIHAPHFVMYVKEQLVNQFGEQVVEQGGLKVMTTLDWEKQNMAEEAVEEVATDLFADAGANNTALVAMNPKTGEILSLVGSRDFFDDEIDGQFNVATLGRRQPGSSFKPIVYAAAFEKGYTPETVLFDVVTNFAASGAPYRPLNYDLREHGPVTMRQALQGSLNIPAVKTLYLVGAKKGVEFAERLGYTTFSEGNFGLSLVLGGGEVRLLDHVRAYAVFANGGVRHEPVSILKVEDANSDVLHEWKPARGERVLDEKITATMSHVLSDDAARAYAFGAGGVLTLPGRSVAAKTGTTNNYVDGWTIGYTPSLVAGVWVGNTDNTPMKRGFGGSRVAGPIWNRFMKKALEGSPVESFPGRPPNDANKPVLRGSDGGSVTLLIDEVTGKRATSSTPKEYIVERTYTQPHSILHYVQKDDPRAESPGNPGEDPQYFIWEAAIQDWVRRKKEENPDWDIVFEEPPTEFDDAHLLALIPSLEVVYPAPSSTIKTREIATDIRVSAPRGVTEVQYRIDGIMVGTVREHPFNLHYTAERLAPGAHVFSITVSDDVGNRLTKEIPFTLSAPEAPPSVRWDVDALTIRQDEFPRTLFLRHYRLNDIAAVVITAQREGGDAVQSIARIDEFSNQFNNQLIVQIPELADKGTWLLRAQAELTDGSRISPAVATITIP